MEISHREETSYATHKTPKGINSREMLFVMFGVENALCQPFWQHLHSTLKSLLLEH